MSQSNKKQLINALNELKGIEKSAGEFYVRIAVDPDVEDEETRETFKKIARDEERHTEIVQKIIDIVNNNL